MALITCPECGKEVSDKAATCVNCGRPMAQSQQPDQKKKGGGGRNSITCRKCKGHNVQVLAGGINSKQQIVRNVNPLQPFTSAKIKQKKKVSGGKVFAAVMTVGTSAIFTGVRKEKQYELFCADCGYRWKSK